MVDLIFYEEVHAENEFLWHIIRKMCVNKLLTPGTKALSSTPGVEGND